MKILVLGASAGIGEQLVQAALQAGHQVTAFSRHPDKLNASGPHLKRVAGDFTRRRDLATVVSGQDAVCICVGTSPTRKEVDLFSSGTGFLLELMDSGQKLVAITGIGAGDSRGHGGFFYDRVVQPLMLASIYRDKDRQEQMIEQSSLDWLIVRPGFLGRGRATGSYHVAENLDGIRSGKISRADVADFVLKQLENPTLFGKKLLLTS